MERRAGAVFPSLPQSQFRGAADPRQRGTDPPSAPGNWRANGFVQTIL